MAEMHKGNRLYVLTMGTNKLRKQAGMSEETWADFWCVITKDLENPANRILLEGPEVNVTVWENRLDEYVVEGLAERFWGEGTSEKWSLGTTDEEPDRAMFAPLQFCLFGSVLVIMDVNRVLGFGTSSKMLLDMSSLGGTKRQQKLLTLLPGQQRWRIETAQALQPLRKPQQNAVGYPPIPLTRLSTPAR